MKQSLWLALGFLTRLPVRTVEFGPATLAKSVLWFPGVGLAIGIVVAMVFTAGATVVGHLGASFLALVTWIGLTGGLHLDGVADSFDGLSASGSDRARGLAAMKDSRLGAHGAVALVVVILGKYVSLVELVNPGQTGQEWSGYAWAGVLIAPLWARVLVVFAMTYLEPVVGSKLALMFRHALRPCVAWWNLGWLVIPATLLLWGSGWQPLGWGLLAMLCGGLAAAGFVVTCHRRFGGVSGDTHGAMIELAELTTLLTWGAHG